MLVLILLSLISAINAESDSTSIYLDLSKNVNVTLKDRIQSVVFYLMGQNVVQDKINIFDSGLRNSATIQISGNKIPIYFNFSENVFTSVGGTKCIFDMIIKNNIPKFQQNIIKSDYPMEVEYYSKKSFLLLDTNYFITKTFDIDISGNINMDIIINGTTLRHQVNYPTEEASINIIKNKLGVLIIHKNSFRDLDMIIKHNTIDTLIFLSNDFKNSTCVCNQNIVKNFYAPDDFDLSKAVDCFNRGSTPKKITKEEALNIINNFVPGQEASIMNKTLVTTTTTTTTTQTTTTPTTTITTTTPTTTSTTTVTTTTKSTTIGTTIDPEYYESNGNLILALIVTGTILFFIVALIIVLILKYNKKRYWLVDPDQTEFL
ncbi:hypothetical protein [Carp edema virus]|nr:hypothetical protein [Carp edema virus]